MILSKQSLWTGRPIDLVPERLLMLDLTHPSIIPLAPRIDFHCVQSHRQDKPKILEFINVRLLGYRVTASAGPQ